MSASVADETVTPGEAPLLAELESLELAELELGEVDALLGMAPLGSPDGVTWNGAEKRWGLLKSS